MSSGCGAYHRREGLGGREGGPDPGRPRRHCHRPRGWKAKAMGACGRSGRGAGGARGNVWRPVGRSASVGPGGGAAGSARRRSGARSPAALRLRGIASFRAERRSRSPACSFAGLGDVLAPLEPDAFDGLPAPQRRGLEIALLRAEAEERPPDPRTIGTALVSLLSGLTAEAPVLVAVDDVQWLDRPSARALEFAVRRLEDHPVIVLATLRVPASRARTWGCSRR